MTVPDGVVTDPSVAGASTDTGLSGVEAPVDATSVPGGDGTPFVLVILTMDYCSRTFGVAPCTATGTKCFNTYPTCKDTPNYGKTTKDYRFYSCDVRHKVALARPYVLDLKQLSTEIKTNLTVSGQVNVSMSDEEDGDVGIDPYVSERSYFPDIPGTFWKKFAARNRNYKGRPFKVYECWTGLAEGSWTLRWHGAIENIKIGRGKVTIEAVDLLKDLSKVEIPPKLSIKILTDITAIQTDLTLDDAMDLPATGYLKIDDEVMSYTSRDTGTGVVSGLTRGLFTTTAVAHNAKAKVVLCRYLPLGNPFDHFSTLLSEDGGLAAGNIDTPAINYWRDYPGGEINVSALITDVDRVKLDKLILELADMLDCKVWQNEEQKITLSRNLPNDPARTVIALTDATEILDDSGSADLNEKARLTRVAFYWNKSPILKLDEPASYDRLEVAIDAEAEGANEYNSVTEKTFWCRWLSLFDQQEEVAQTFAVLCARRLVARYRDAPSLIIVSVDAKDLAIKTGDWVTLSTDELLDIYGNSIAAIQHMVVKRERKDTRIVLTLLAGTGRIGENKRNAFVHHTGSPADFGAATAAEKAYGYISAATGKMSDGTAAYTIF